MQSVRHVYYVESTLFWQKEKPTTGVRKSGQTPGIRTSAENVHKKQKRTSQGYLQARTLARRCTTTKGIYQRCTESETFDSDSAPASAEYTPTPAHFNVFDSDSCSNSKVNYLNFWQCLNDRIRFSC